MWWTGIVWTVSHSIVSNTTFSSLRNVEYLWCNIIVLIIVFTDFLKTDCGNVCWHRAGLVTSATRYQLNKCQEKQRFRVWLCLATMNPDRVSLPRTSRSSPHIEILMKLAPALLPDSWEVTVVLVDLIHSRALQQPSKPFKYRHSVQIQPRNREVYLW